MDCVMNSEHQQKSKTANSNIDLIVLARRLECRVNQKSMGDDREGHEMSMGDTVKEILYQGRLQLLHEEPML